MAICLSGRLLVGMITEVVIIQIGTVPDKLIAGVAAGKATSVGGQLLGWILH